jgi:hypothetical protein
VTLVDPDGHCSISAHDQATADFCAAESAAGWNGNPLAVNAGQDIKVSNKKPTQGNPRIVNNGQDIKPSNNPIKSTPAAILAAPGDPYTTTDASGRNWSVTPLVGGMAEYTITIPIVPGYEPIDEFGDFMAMELQLTFKAGMSGGALPQFVLHSDGGSMVLDTPNASIDLSHVAKSGPVASVTTGSSSSGDQWAQTSYNVSASTSSNGLASMLNINAQSVFQGGSTGNGAMVEIDSTVATQFLHVSQGPGVPELMGGGVLAVGALAAKYGPEAWQDIQEANEACPLGSCI